MKRSKALVIGLACATVITVAALDLEIYRETSFTCLPCRAVDEKQRICGFSFESIKYDEFSAQLLGSAPVHQHEWRYCGSTHTTSLLTFAYGCGRRHPIWDIPPKAQLRYKELVSDTQYEETLTATDSQDRNAAEAAAAQLLTAVTN